MARRDARVSTFCLENKEREENRDLVKGTGLYIPYPCHSFPLRKQNTSVLSSHLPVELLCVHPRPEPLRAGLWNPTPCIETPVRMYPCHSFPASRHQFGCTRVILFLCANKTHQSSPLIFLSSCSAFIPVLNLCAHRDRKSRPPEPVLRCAGNQVFGKCLPRLLATWNRRERLLSATLDRLLAYIFFTPVILSLCANKTHQSSPLISLSSCSAFIPVPNLSSHLPVELLCVHLRPEPLRAGLRNPTLHRDTYSGVPVSFFLSAQTKHISKHISPLLSSACRVALRSSPSRTSARTEIGRAGLRNPCLGVRAIRFLRSVFCDCLLPGIGEIGYFLRPRIGFFYLNSTRLATSCYLRSTSN